MTYAMAAIDQAAAAGPDNLAAGLNVRILKIMEPPYQPRPLWCSVVICLPQAEGKEGFEVLYADKPVGILCSAFLHSQHPQSGPGRRQHTLIP